jgi:DNA-directed RNA polymerase subunit K/omega
LQSYESLSAIHQDKLADIVGGKFHLTRLVSIRLRDIYNGAPLLVERHENEATLAAVCREIEDGLITLEAYESVTDQEEADFDVLGIGEDM